MVDREINTPLDGIKGGVLADEVGLGKTLEILGLVSSNKRYSERNMMLPSPDPAEASFDSKATLIISPKYMVAQWQSEVAKHCNESVKVVVYEGMKAMQKLLGIRSSEEAGYYFRTNNVFATYDVVLTSYEVLRQEVYFTDEFAARVTRADAVMPKEKIRTPLVLCRWWRVCMDEAQELKLSTTQTARMALRVPAYYRWGVSGTPIKRIFADIKGSQRVKYLRYSTISNI
jgi:E3 ubiquitin-protein ligase SHPRH